MTAPTLQPTAMPICVLVRARSATSRREASVLWSAQSSVIENGGRFGVMALDGLPVTACWRHEGARTGFEVAFFDPMPTGWRIKGTTAALQDGQTSVVTYRVGLDTEWRTRIARVTTVLAHASWVVALDSDGNGSWTVNGAAARHLDGCFDVDLELSAVTNALPVHRQPLQVGDRMVAPAAYVRAVPGPVERLEQLYERVEGSDGHSGGRVDPPAFDFSCQLVYDAQGLVVSYPGIAVRAG